jgi:hypothetical protein
MRTNRFYFCIKFWLLDWVVHTIFVICCWLARAKVGPKQYRKYLKKDCRFKFQVDLGIALLNYVIGAEGNNLSNLVLNGCIHRIGFHASVNCPSSVLTGWLMELCIGSNMKWWPHTFNMTTHVWSKKGCSDQRVQLNRGSQFCRMCYRKQVNGTEEE